MRKRAGLKGFRFHDVRHDMATKLLRQTKNLKLVSRALNHSDIKTTSRYAHVFDSEVSEALQRLSRSKSPTESPTPPSTSRLNHPKSLAKSRRG
jgi:integrase